MSRDDHLSQISTLWTLVQQAHHGPLDTARSAQEVLLKRYSPAVYRYLLGALRDPNAADELFQEFCLRFVRGDFRRADPERGRFRSFVKTSLFHLVVDYQNQRRKTARPLAEEPPVAAPDDTAAEREFTASWRQELLDRAWRALAEVQQQTGQPVYAVLRLRVDHPQWSSAQLAEQLGARLGKPLTAGALRKALHRARQRFAEVLLDEVAVSLEDPAPERLEQELLDLGLMAYCRLAFDQRTGG
jgi:RNA polymerase sigma-70 factor (ECF subfamily)